MRFRRIHPALNFVNMQRTRASYIVEGLIHAIFWLVIYYALKAQTAFSFRALVGNHSNMLSADGRMLFPYAWVVLLFIMLLFYSTGFWLFDKLESYTIMRRITGVAGWVTGLYVLNYWLIRWMAIGAGTTTRELDQILPGPPALLPNGALPLRSFSIDDWWTMQPMIALIFMLAVSVALAYFYITESIRKELVRSKAEAQQASTELQFLRSQVNPHFLFNTLNNLFSMAQKEGKNNVADKIAKLSGMMRYMLYDNNTESVPLEKEIAYLEDCIALHQMRYAESQLEVSFRYPDEEAIGLVQLAPMLLIPFLENAFKHGVRAGYHSRIAMAISLEGKKLSFSCENTDHSVVKKITEEAGGIGLENVKRRLQLVYPGRHELWMRSINGIYNVNLEIDLI